MLDVYSVKKRIWKVDIGKIIIAVNYFRKMLHCWCLTGFWICLRFCTWQGSEYDGVLNISGLWIYQGWEYVRVLICHGSEYARVQNIPGSWKCQGSDCTRVLNVPGFWICLWSWICQDSEYASGSEYTGFLKMAGFWLYQHSE